MMRFSGFLSVLLMVSACTDLQNTRYDYAFISQARTYASAADLPGQVYLLNLSDEGATLTELDLYLPIDDSMYETLGPASLTSSRVVGASADLVRRGVVQASGSLEFDASVKATNTTVRRITGAQASRMMESAYRDAVATYGTDDELPLYAREVVENPDIYYAFVTGRMDTDELVLKHGTSEDENSGFTVSINGIEFSNVKVGNRTVWSCKSPDQQADQQRAACAISIDVLDARFVARDGEQLLRVRPATVEPKRIAQAFRSRS